MILRLLEIALWAVLISAVLSLIVASLIGHTESEHNPEQGSQESQ